jgi:hypothetical protein
LNGLKRASCARRAMGLQIMGFGYEVWRGMGCDIPYGTGVKMEMDIRGPGGIESSGSLWELDLTVRLSHVLQTSPWSAISRASEATISALKGFVNLFRQPVHGGWSSKDKRFNSEQSQQPQMLGCPEAVNSAFSVLQSSPRAHSFEPAPRLHKRTLSTLRRR